MDFTILSTRLESTVPGAIRGPKDINNGESPENVLNQSFDRSTRTVNHIICLETAVIICKEEDLRVEVDIEVRYAQSDYNDPHAA